MLNNKDIKDNGTNLFEFSLLIPLIILVAIIILIKLFEMFSLGIRTYVL